MTAVVLAWLLVSPLDAQLPTGMIAGSVTDATGAALVGATVTVTQRETNQPRVVATSESGSYVVPGLPPGPYVVAIEVARFKRAERPVTIEAGTTTTADVVMQPGMVTETVTVAAAQPLLQYEHPQLAGVITRAQIENLPLNGRSVFELVKLEPGVTNPTRGGFNRTFVAVLGSGLMTIPRVGYTRATVDGANIGSVGAIGTGMQVSQEAVQEFQMTTAGFDLSTGATTNGVMNIVTRSGGTIVQGSGFYFYRDHHLSAYPGLVYDPRNPDPFFRRQQFGAIVSGPLRSDQRFFLVSYERNNQQGIMSVRPSLKAFEAFGGLFSMPAEGDLLTVRADARVTSRHHAFGRYTLDANRTFSATMNVLPSGWARSVGRVHQGLGALTSVWSTAVVNELRVAYFAPSVTSTPVTSEDCAGCFGLDHPRLAVDGANVTLGRAPSQEFVTSRFEIGNTVNWQRGRHSVRAGLGWEHGTSQASASGELAITLWRPDRIDSTIPVPASFNTVDDFLQLPFKSLETSIGPGTIPERGFRPVRVLDFFRLYATDTWRVQPRVTTNGGVAWIYEPNVLNYDLEKPAWLAPLMGDAGVGPPRVQLGNVSAAGGVSWMATRDGRTVVRAGAGRYFDPLASTNGTNLGNERIFLSPLGAARLPVTAGNIIVNGQSLAPLRDRASTFTGAQLLAILPERLQQLASLYNPANQDFTVRTIDLLKTGRNLYDPGYVTPWAVHLTAGLQREIGSGFVISADAVWKRFEHTFINGIDYNHFGATGRQVIRTCRPEEVGQVTATCTTGPIYFDTTIGSARYRGLLVRAEKRLSRGWQLLTSYAYGSYVGCNGTGLATAEMSGGRVFGFNNDDWSENYGPMPTDLRHVLNVSGLASLPWRIQLAFSVSAYSRPPFSAYVAGTDFNGDGTSNDLLPGSEINAFGRSLDKDDLVRLVNDYNLRYAPAITLPESYSFDDTFFTQDVRVSRSFELGRGRARLVLLVEVFNLLNTDNFAGYSGDLKTPSAFGQPGARFTQVFGSGGPRAAQLGARLSF